MSRWVFGCCLVLPLWIGMAQGAAPSQESTQAELRQVRGRIDSIRKAINEDVQRRDAVTVQLKDTELGIQTAQQKLAATRAERQATEIRLRELRAEQEATKKQVEEEREALAGELKVAYLNGRDERLKLLLNQQDPAMLGRMLAYYGYFGQARAERINAIRDHVAHLELLEVRIADEARRLDSIEAARAAEVERLAQARNRRSRTLASLQTQIKSRGDELARLERDAKTLERLVEQLRRAMEDFPVLAQQPFERVRGKLPWPAKGKVLARFGQLRAGGPLKWQGLLIDTQRGAQIRAPFHGRVVYADWLPGMGLLLVLDHGNGYMSLYGHNEQLFKAVGDRVAPGDVMAAAGDSGGNSNAGLYMEIRKGGQPQDPLLWLTKP
ncbi:MAG: peptidoglycan DD-metalloendopeptidase family protein [Steroidobacteraceae bacterium]